LEGAEEELKSSPIDLLCVSGEFFYGTASARTSDLGASVGRACGH
jgi:hypothetical protein